MPITKPKSTSNLVCELRQRLNLSQERFAAKLGVSFKSANRWQNGRSKLSPMALKLIDDQLRQMGVLGKALLNQYFLEMEQCDAR